jgi:hypothetical protein
MPNVIDIEGVGDVYSAKLKQASGVDTVVDSPLATQSTWPRS